MPKRIPLVVNENSPIHDIVSEYNHESRMGCIDYINHVFQCKLCMETIEMFQMKRAVAKMKGGKKRNAKTTRVR